MAVAAKLKEEQIGKVRERKVTLFESFRDKYGTIWYLVPRETSHWPNNNPHRILYENLWGSKLIIWLNEFGGMIYAQYA